MKRLPGILLITGATLLVGVALLVSGLRLVLPQIDRFRPQILEHIERTTGYPLTAGKLEANWQSFGPTLEIHDVKATFKQGDLSVKRVSVALDVWQSLLHLRFQFRNLTFYQFNVTTDAPLTGSEKSSTFEPNKLTDLFLHQFDHFDLRDSHIHFVTPSGQRAQLAIPQLTWLNGPNRHRAEGAVSLSSFNGQHGVVNVRMDLRDERGLLDRGTVWLQADDIDVKPWLGQWMKDNVELQSAHFSLEAWMHIAGGDIAGGDLRLRKGGIRFQGDNGDHHLTVDNLTAHVSQIDDGWLFQVPATNIAIDKVRWPKSAVAVAWIPGADVNGRQQNSGELRIRASQLQIERLSPLIALTHHLMPELGKIWHTMRPTGFLDALAVDVPLQHTEKSRFRGQWRDVSWQQWKLMPGIKNLSGSVSGSLPQGQMKVSVNHARMPYEGVFRAPLEINRGNATLSWQQSDSGFTLRGRQIDIQANALWANGDFTYQQPKNDLPWLSILAGIRTTDGGQAWRYFPENLMGKHLVDYLSGAIKGGQVDNATLVFGGNPQLFPYKHNEGQFEVKVPLHNATFAFQPGWPAISGFNIDLDFINNGLWMTSPVVMLGGVKATDLTAVISDYSKDKLLIETNIFGPGREVGSYFQKTPLNKSLGAALEQLQLAGDVSARLHLDIPFTGEPTRAEGKVTLTGNSLFIKPLNSTIEDLRGSFDFHDGNLTSGPLNGRWFNQPLALDFSTHEGDKSYTVGVNVKGNWQPTRTGMRLKQVESKISGAIPWQGKVDIALPYHAGATYRVALEGNLNDIQSKLPVPLDKARGETLPFHVAVNGDLRHFDLSGNMGANSRFNSRWLLGKKLALDRAIWATDSRTMPPLPSQAGIELNLPALDGAEWLALFKQGESQKVDTAVTLPERVTLRTPALQFGGQRWNNLSLVSQPMTGGTQLNAQGREINGRLTISDRGPWQLALQYLYYNPDISALTGKVSPTQSGSTAAKLPPTGDERFSFAGWPNVQIRCAECWLLGQKYGRLDGDVTINGDTLRLSNGLLDTGFGRVTAQGTWVNTEGAPRTSLKGKVYGKSWDATTAFLGITTPLRAAAFHSDFDLHWRQVPWKPDVATLNGIVNTRLGKGQIEDIGTGRAGQLLRLVSFDALLRKLRFDFSDTFGQGFYFDSIRSMVWIKDGVMHTDNTAVDGLEADIAMEGSIDLNRRQIDMVAVVAPEISATVGVAAAFAVNPIVGAAVFAASKVLGPVWSKISVLRYQITGPLDKPQVKEVLRK